MHCTIWNKKCDCPKFGALIPNPHMLVISQSKHVCRNGICGYDDGHKTIIDFESNFELHTEFRCIASTPIVDNYIAHKIVYQQVHSPLSKHFFWEVQNILKICIVYVNSHISLFVIHVECSLWPLSNYGALGAMFVQYTSKTFWFVVWGSHVWACSIDCMPQYKIIMIIAFLPNILIPKQSRTQTILSTFVNLWTVFIPHALWTCHMPRIYGFLAIHACTTHMHWS